MVIYDITYGYLYMYIGLFIYVIYGYLYMLCYICVIYLFII